ncbi:MAG TPA: protein kinase [Solirubrobacter sp.]|nr:protein kinase [Solirubrobacter sp.]
MRELEPGDVFAGHRIEAVAGRGGMGVVYRATQLALDRTVALKVIAPGLLEDQNVRHRFVRESKVAASIDHPNVIPIYYAGQENGVAYIAMRYVAGDDVRSLVRREGPLPPQRAAAIVAQIGSALDDAHAAGLVHRDVKPANVLIATGDHVYLTDFGLTKHALSVAGTTKPGHWVGTLDYVAPEQIRGERVDARADVYALGCVLFFTLTGQVPFKRDGDEARLWAHLSEPPPKPSSLDPEIPKAFDDVIERALAKDPEDRYPSAGDLGRAALAAATNRRPDETERLVAKGAAAPIEAATVTAARPQDQTKRQPEPETRALTPSKSPRRRGLIAAALVLVAAVGVGTAFALTRDHKDTPPPPRPTPTATPTPTPTPEGQHILKTLTVGKRPNVVRVAGDIVFVGSFRNDRVDLIDVKKRKKLAYRPKVGVGAADAVVVGDSIWFAISRSNQLVRLNASNGHRIGDPVKVAFQPTTITYARGAIWAGLVRGKGLPDQLVKVDPKTGQILLSVDYPLGISALTASPTAVWAAARRSASVQRIDPATGQILKDFPVGGSYSEDIAYSRGSLWLASPDDDTVYSVDPESGQAIAIGVGRHPRQLAATKDAVYVTNYNSSDLTTIDVKTLHTAGETLELPVNPYSLSVDGDTLWVASQPRNQLSAVAIGRDG